MLIHGGPFVDQEELQRKELQRVFNLRKITSQYVADLKAARINDEDLEDIKNFLSQTGLLDKSE